MEERGEEAPAVFLRVVMMVLIEEMAAALVALTLELDVPNLSG